jgi:hypothetical protein
VGITIITTCMPRFCFCAYVPAMDNHDDQIADSSSGCCPGNNNVGRCAGNFSFSVSVDITITQCDIKKKNTAIVIVMEVRVCFFSIGAPNITSW